MLNQVVTNKIQKANLVIEVIADRLWVSQASEKPIVPLPQTSNIVLFCNYVLVLLYSGNIHVHVYMYIYLNI